MFGISLMMFLVTKFGTFYLNNTFLYDPKIFTLENICHYV